MRRTTEEGSEYFFRQSHSSSSLTVDAGPTCGDPEETNDKGAGVRGFCTSLPWHDGGLLDLDDEESALFSNSLTSVIGKLRGLAREVAKSEDKDMKMLRQREDESIYKKKGEPLSVFLGKSADPRSRNSQDWAWKIQNSNSPAPQISQSNDAIFKRKVRSKKKN
ncbi:hypothetical protein Rs2_41114 [Raphanus sativus]|nr:hypothetical protein Rs2_41114 [Raphanus sativus]